MNEYICTKCGALLSGEQEFCPKCGTPKGTFVPSISICSSCGAELQKGQEFCSKCGQKASVEPDITQKPKIKKKILIIIVAVVMLIVAAIVGFIIYRGPQAQSVTLSRKLVEVKAGEVVTLSFTIDPENTKDKTVTWVSSRQTIATVKDGMITGLNEGNCVITISTANGKTDTCEVTVLAAGPNLKDIYDKYCDSDYASVATDGSYLTLDTNPDDIKDYLDFSAHDAIKQVNKALGFSEALIQRMGETRSIDGIQSFSNDEVEVTWNYHPRHGLEVVYSLK